MENLALLVLCFAVGIILRRSGRLPDNAHAALNGFIVHISLPALILLHVHRLTLDASMIFPVLAPWILFGSGLMVFSALGKVMRWAPATTGGLVLSSSLANTSFVGLPMIEVFYGPSFLGIGILIDQLGTYMVLSTVGILVAAVFAADQAGRLSGRTVLRKIATFVPFQALLLAIVLRPVPFPEAVEVVLGRLGATLAPLALVSVGYQLRLSDVKGRIKPLAAGLSFKLVIAPLLIMVIFVKGLGLDGPLTQVTIFEVAMAPQIGGAIVAMEHKLDPPLVTLMVGIGIPLSFITLPMWWYLLQGLSP